MRLVLTSRARRAFTLLELSIVLIIVGLIAGGILTGQQLMRNAEIQAVLSDLRAQEAAITSFRDKYTSLPGDMPYATQFWGVLAGTGVDATCQNTAATDAKTCNGDGNGIISTSIVTGDEGYRAWQHLKNAELITGTFQGSTNSVAINDLVGKVLPKSKLKNAGYQFFYESKLSQGWANTSEASSDLQLIRIAAPRIATELGASVFTPIEAWNIDDKIDDGNPATGNVFAHFTLSGTACATTNNATATPRPDYAKTLDDVSCFLSYRIIR